MHADTYVPLLHPKREGKNVLIKKRLLTKVLAYAYLAVLSQPRRTHLSLMPQLESIVIEVVMVQVLRLRGHCMVPNICHQQMGPMIKQDFTITKSAILT